MAVSIEQAYAISTTDAHMVEAFDGFGPIPGIDRIENLGPPSEVGLRRIIHNSDGNSVEEVVVLLDGPKHHAYELSNFTGPFRFLVRAARADWSFVAEGDETVVRWDYAFETTNALAWPIVWALMPLFSRAQQRALDALSRLS